MQHIYSINHFNKFVLFIYIFKTQNVNVELFYMTIMWCFIVSLLSGLSCTSINPSFITKDP